MDPATILSIVNGSAGLAIKCGQVVIELNELVHKYKHAELSIRALTNECTSMKTMLDQLATWMQSSNSSMRLDEQVWRQMESNVECGRLFTSALEADLRSLEQSTKAGNFIRRTRIVWNEGIFKEHADRIRGLNMAIAP